MALTGCYACMKYLVIVFNLLFWLAGIGVLAVSVWLYIDSAAYLAAGDDSYMYFTAIYILMAAGALMTLVGFLGCCGALHESSCMLGMFFVFLLVIFVAEVTGGVWAWLHKDEVKEIIKTQVTKMVKDDYGVSEEVTKTIDAMQHDLGCCGANSPSDWAQSKFANVGKIEIGISSNLGLYEVPSSCCTSNIEEECDLMRKIKIAGVFLRGIYSEGCIPKLQNYFDEHIIIIIGVGIGVGVIQILGLIFSLALCCAIRSGVGDPMKA